MNPDEFRIVEDEWFITVDPGVWSLRPYWEEKHEPDGDGDEGHAAAPGPGLSPCTLTDSYILTLLQRANQTEDLQLAILSAHFAEFVANIGTHPDWLEDRADWLEDASRKRASAYTPIRVAVPLPPDPVEPRGNRSAEERAELARLYDDWWNHVEASLAGNRWYELLVRGYPENITPPRPLLRFEQYNLIVDALPDELRVKLKLKKKAAPKYLWTKN